MDVYGQINKGNNLHATIGWSATTLWTLPINILGWTLDVACFAVDTVLSIDNQITFTSFFIFNIFINTSGAKG